MISFVLRVASGRNGLRGTATHVASGETRAFATPVELWTFLEEWAAVDGIAAASAEWIPELPEPDSLSDPCAEAPDPGSALYPDAGPSPPAPDSA